MEYLPLLLVILFFFFPIVLPLVFWYILKNRDSKIFTYSRYTRRFWSLLTLMMVIGTFYKHLPDFSFELLGQVFAQMIIAILLWKRWGITPKVEHLDMNTSDKV